MSKVKVLYARNLTQEITEDALKEEFERYGTVERVKKIKDYAFVHFEDRDCAVKAMQELDGKEMGGARLEVSLAKPPSDKKKKEEILRARERRMMQMIHGRGGCSPVLRGRTPQPQPRPPQARGDYGWVMWDGRAMGAARGGAGPRGWGPWWCAPRRAWPPHAQRHAWQSPRQAKFTR